MRSVFQLRRAQLSATAQRALHRLFWADRRGVTAVEYAIIAGIMVVAVILSLPAVAPSIKTIFSSVSTEL